MGADIGDAYPAAHLPLETLGRLKHRFGERDRAEVLPVWAVYPGEGSG